MYGVRAVGSSGEEQYFEKPLLLTFVMFVAMSLALPLHWATTWHQARLAKATKASAPSEATSLLMLPAQPPTAGNNTSWREMLILVVPATFDLLATALGSIGLLFTTVSIYQLIRCSIMIMTALLKVIFWREKLRPHMWVGIGINTVATLLVSLVNFAPGHTDEQPGPYRDPRIGVIFILLSCVVQASQYVFEEKLMTDAQDSCPPLVVVGAEGVWGAAIMLAIVLPWAGLLPGSDQGGCVENAMDSWIMLQNSGTVSDTIKQRAISKHTC